MPLFELAAVEIATLIAEEEAAALATAAAESAAEAAVNEAGAQEVARQGIMQAPVEAGAGAGAGAAQAGTDVNAGVSQGITGVEPAQPLPQAGPNPQLKPIDPMAETMQKLYAEEALKTASTNPGTQLAGTTTNAPGFNPGYASDAYPNQFIPQSSSGAPSTQLSSFTQPTSPTTPFSSSSPTIDPLDPFGGFPSSGPTPPPASTESAANVINTLI
jgi:hypothetical protein